MHSSIKLFFFSSGGSDTPKRKRCEKAAPPTGGGQHQPKGGATQQEEEEKAALPSHKGQESNKTWSKRQKNEGSEKRVKGTFESTFTLTLKRPSQKLPLYNVQSDNCCMRNCCFRIFLNVPVKVFNGSEL